MTGSSQPSTTHLVAMLSDFLSGAFPGPESESVRFSVRVLSGSRSDVVREPVRMVSASEPDAVNGYANGYGTHEKRPSDSQRGVFTLRMWRARRGMDTGAPPTRCRSGAVEHGSSWRGQRDSRHAGREGHVALHPYLGVTSLHARTLWPHVSPWAPSNQASRLANVMSPGGTLGDARICPLCRRTRRFAEPASTVSLCPARSSGNDAASVGVLFGSVRAANTGL
jgi:hypothetical protein